MDIATQIIKEMEMVYLHDKRPWIIGFSGGKDSTTVCQLVFQMIQQLPREKRHKSVYIVSSDTMVENPIIINYLKNISEQMGNSAKEQGLPIETHMVKPDLNETFWTLVIGRGYPTPEPPGFRWCTERLKINPSNRFIREKIKKDGDVIILLGVRKAESTARAHRITNREIEGKLLNKHEVIDGAYVYNPITELTTDEVWSILIAGSGISPWGSDNNELLKLYKSSDGGECPFTVVSANEVKNVPTCGNTRFGCWCCTMVKEDKSLKGFIESGEDWLIPLREFRDWLLSIRNEPSMRDWKRRNGSVYRKNDGSYGLGPFTLEGRRKILEALLQLENETDLTLINMDELKIIDEIWDKEGDLSRRMLVDTYKNIKGNELPWAKYKKPIFDKAIIEQLNEYCLDSDVPFELMSKLIISVNRTKYITRKPIVKQEFERIINENWLHHEKMIEGIE